MIEDTELRELFKAESAEHLQKLEEGLLRLEKKPDDQAVLKELRREIHSIKGSARMLGVNDVQTVAHRIEDIISSASGKESPITAAVADQVLRGLDGIRELVKEAVGDGSSTISFSKILAQLKENGQAIGPVGKEIPEETPKLDTMQDSPSENTEDSLASPEPSIKATAANSQYSSQSVSNTTEMAQDSDEVSRPLEKQSDSESLPADDEEETTDEEQSYQIDTIRVSSKKLDQLMNQSRELTVIRTRTKRRLTEVEELIYLIEQDSFKTVEYSSSSPVSEKDGRPKQIIDNHLSSLHRLRKAMYDDEVGLELVSRELEEGIQNLRLLPLSTVFNLFPRMVRDLSRQQEKKIRLEINGGDASTDKFIIEQIKDPLIHLLRNAIDHGIESSSERVKNGKTEEGVIQVKASRTASMVKIEVSDDGRGLALESIKKVAEKQHLHSKKELEAMSASQLQALVFRPGFSTSTLVTDLSGRGVGLDVVGSRVEQLKGDIRLTSKRNEGCCFSIWLPTALTNTPVFIVAAGGSHFAIPLDAVHSVRRVYRKEMYPMEGRQTVSLGGSPVSVARLTDLLEMASDTGSKEGAVFYGDSPKPCVVLAWGEEKLAVLVDEIVEEMETVVKPHSSFLKRVRNVAGSTILGTGEVCMVLNPRDLIKTVEKHRGVQFTVPSGGEEEAGSAGQEVKVRILLAEDSITTRTQLKRILEGADYDVVTAVDGLDAFNKLSAGSFDAIVSDIEMPNLTGLELTERIRQNNLYQELPVILVTSLSSEKDKRRGMEVGANAYITKGSFNQTALLDTLRRLV